MHVFHPKQRNVRSFNLPPHVSDRQTQDNSHIRCEGKKGMENFFVPRLKCAAKQLAPLNFYAFPLQVSPTPLFALAASSQPYPMRFQESLTTLLPSCLCCSSSSSSSSSSTPSSKNQLFREMQFLRGFEPLYKVITCGKGGRVQFFPMGAGSRRHLKFIHPRWNDEKGGKKIPLKYWRSFLLSLRKHGLEIGKKGLT